LNEFPVPDKIIEIDLPKVAKSSLAITAGALLLLWILKVVIEREFLFSLSLGTVVFFIVGYILLIILHELFHLLGFRLFGGVPWRKMIVGVNLKMGIAYATTNELMTNRAIRKALLLPFWMTGVLPAIIGLYMGSGLLISLSALLIGGAAGDFAMYKELKELPDDWVVNDDPELPRLYVYSPDKRIESENYIEK
jgi:hypothetical protein